MASAHSRIQDDSYAEQVYALQAAIADGKMACREIVERRPELLPLLESTALYAAQRAFERAKAARDFLPFTIPCPEIFDGDELAMRAWPAVVTPFLKYQCWLMDNWREVHGIYGPAPQNKTPCVKHTANGVSHANGKGMNGYHHDVEPEHDDTLIVVRHEPQAAMGGR